MKQRIIANELYFPVIRELLDSGKEVSVTISGNSMSPFFVHERDRVMLSPVTGKLKKGDIAIFQRDNGKYILHRICRVLKGEQYFFLGDAQTEREGPIRRDQIFGRVTAVCRKGKWIRPGDFLWEFFRVIWLRIVPFRMSLRRMWGSFRQRKGKKCTSLEK